RFGIEIRARNRSLSLSDSTPFREGRDVLALDQVEWTRTLQAEGPEHGKRLNRQWPALPFTILPHSAFSRSEQDSRGPPLFRVKLGNSAVLPHGQTTIDSPPEPGRRSGLSGTIWAHCRRSKGTPFEATTFLIRVRFLREFVRWWR